MRHLFRVFVATLCLAGAAAAWSAGTPPSEPVSATASSERSARMAREAYEAGVDSITKADELAADPKMADRAAKAYRRARDKFEDAVTHAPSMAEAWNYLGYARRKLGSYESALAAYDRALELRPDYPQAIEYRAEAYLGLNRIEDAKQAYLDLFAADRQLAGQLLTAMQKWLADRKAAGGADPAVADLEKWVRERAQIATQAASLTREGSGASWR